MKIEVTDVFTNESVELTATMTTDHPASSYGQPVMVVDEWNDCMSHQNWILAGGRIIEATEAERADFARWYSLIEAMAGGLP